MTASAPDCALASVTTAPSAIDTHVVVVPEILPVKTTESRGASTRRPAWKSEAQAFRVDADERPSQLLETATNCLKQLSFKTIAYKVGG